MTQQVTKTAKGVDADPPVEEPLYDTCECRFVSAMMCTICDHPNTGGCDCECHPGGLYD